jgi:WD repeat-containing protein 55
VPFEHQPDLDFEVVRVGKSYHGNLDGCDKANLEAYLYEQRPHEAYRPAPSLGALDEQKTDSNIFQPLNGPEEMRIIELYPGEFENILTCKTHVCTLKFEYPERDAYHQETRDPETYDLAHKKKKVGPAWKRHTRHAVSIAANEPIWYTALSYAWGGSAFLKPITCNGKAFQTTHNLDRALRYLRRKDVSVMLWVDQICINQEDIAERNQQVTLMGKIYRRAYSTMVWLGEEADNSDDIFRIIEDVPTAFRSVLDERAPDPDRMSSFGLPPPGSRQWLYLSRFLSRPWFHRAWVIQEVVMSIVVQVQCGWKSVSWQDIGQFAQCMITHDLLQFLERPNSQVDQPPRKACIGIIMIDRIRAFYNAIKEPADVSNLLSHLAEGRLRQATDARDKVFAMVGMSSNAIHPDYLKSQFEIYKEAAQTILQYHLHEVDRFADHKQPDHPLFGEWVSKRTIMQHELYRLLCCVDHEQPKVCNPSWIPDWSNPRQTISLGYGGPESAVYYAAGYEIKEDAQYEQIGDRLSILGILFDSVSNIGSLASPDLKDLPDTGSPTANFVIESMYMATEHCQPYPSNSGLFEPFWKTLVAGKDETGKFKAPSDYADIFGLLFDNAKGKSPSMPDQSLTKRRLSLQNLQVRRPQRIYRQMQIAFETAVTGRRFGITSKRYMGLFPRGTKLGDQVCVFLGSQVPFVVRRQEMGDSYQLVGECYIHGIMHGEIKDMNLKEEKIEIE